MTGNPSFPPGYLVGGRYELVERLGQGGHGAVYRAIQRPLGREVAVKMILAEAMFADGMLERFSREAGLVQRLEHPNTVRIYDFGTSEQGMPFIVFELLRGRTLEDEIVRGPLTPFRIGRVATQVLKSLMEAHALGIVHRDIKPANLLLIDYSGETDFVKVLDFGVAKPTAAPRPGEAITHDGQIIGTPSYMAPEQVHGAVIGPQADLYALGLVMAEAATGQRVYGEGSPMQIWINQTSSDVVPLSPLVMSTALGPVIARATRKEPSERYPSAEVMLADVERALLAGGAPTDPLGKPIVLTRSAELPRVTARLTRDPTPPPPQPPLTPLAMSPTTGPVPPLGPPRDYPPPGSPLPAQAWSPTRRSPSYPGPTSSSRGSSSFTSTDAAPAGASTAIVVLGVVAIVAVLLAVVAGGALFLRSRTPAVAPIATDGPTGATPHGKLAAVTPQRIEERLRAAGWGPMRVTKQQMLGFQMSSWNGAQVNNPSAFIQVTLMDYDNEGAAMTGLPAIATNGIAAERDGGRILYVVRPDNPKDAPVILEMLANAK